MLPLCGQPDGLVHRLWWCPCLQEERQGLMKSSELSYMRAVAEDDPIGTTGVFLHPADVAPQPAEECTVVAVIKGRDRWGQEAEQPAQLDEVPVSYTHLTLPTILRV